MEIPKNWIVQDNKLVRSIEFNTFKDLIIFINAVAYISEKHNHHPDIFISYRKCILTLFTHSEGKITQKDLELSKIIEELL